MRPVVAVSLAFGLLLAAGAAGDASERIARNGPWIAFSTAPAEEQARRDSFSRSGSDILLVRQGGQPRVVAHRGSGSIWNACPTFSPNGKLLAFARRTPEGSSVVVVGIERHGKLTRKVALKVAGSRARCPKWSSDSSRVAYVDPSGRIVVRSLDGSERARAAGDPRRGDFARDKRSLGSPGGSLIASLSGCTIVVSRPNGTGRRVVEDGACNYAIAGWSPDGRKLLVMQDISGRHFTMRAVSVDAPFTSVAIAVGVRVNHARSWPRYGDVSWQPLVR